VTENWNFTLKMDALEEKLDKDRLQCNIIKDGKHEEADRDNRVPSIIAFLFAE